MFTIDGEILVFGQALSPYIMCDLLGLCAGAAIGLLICPKRNLSYNFVFRMVIIVLFFGVLVLTFFNKTPDGLIPFSHLGGLILATALFYSAGKIFHQNPRYCCEIGLITINTYMILTKLGCLFTGCCHGKPYDGFFSVIYTGSSHAALQGISLFPIQLVDALTRTAVLILMLILYYKDYFYRYRIPLYFCLLGNSYYWSSFFWYDEVKILNKSGVDYILIYNIVFGICTLMCIFLQLSYNAGKTTEKPINS